MEGGPPCRRPLPGSAASSHQNPSNEAARFHKHLIQLKIRACLCSKASAGSYLSVHLRREAVDMHQRHPGSAGTGKRRVAPANGARPDRFPEYLRQLVEAALGPMGPAPAPGGSAGVGCGRDLRA